MLAVVAKGLKDLKQKVVFVGGATVDLFITDPAAPATRPTDDVDCVVEIAGTGQYHELEAELRKLGFKHAVGEDAPICRWRFSGIKVDVMPTKGAVLGFSNQWYPTGMANAEEVVLPNKERVRVFSLPYLLASKLAAFRDRGREDFQASKDLEDIIALLDGCPEVEQKVDAAAAEVRQYLGREFKRLLAHDRFLPALEGSLRPGREGPERTERCMALMRRIASMA